MSVTPGNQEFPVPAPCPRCQKDICWTGYLRQLMKGYWTVECVCGWSGPTANSEVNAAIRWNAASVERWLEFDLQRKAMERCEWKHDCHYPMCDCGLSGRTWADEEKDALSATETAGK